MEQALRAHKCLGALTNKKLPGYIESERTILLLVCMCDAIYHEQVLRGYGSNVSPNQHMSDCVHGEALRGVGPSWRYGGKPLKSAKSVHLCARAVIPRHGVMGNLAQPHAFIL